MEAAVRPFAGWERVVNLAPFPLLAAAVTLEYTQPSPGVRFPAVAVLAAATAVWLTAMPLAHPRWSTRWRLGYYLGLLALMGALVWHSQWFTFVSWVVTVQAFMLFPLRWAFFAAAAGAAGFTIGLGERSQSPYLLGVSLLAPLLAAGWYLGRETESRRRLIAELTEALAANERMRERLLEQAREAGVRDERQRLAREIHDTLAQELSGIAAQLETALHAPAADWRPRVGQALELARDGLTEARRSVRALTPGSLAEASLPQALTELVRRWSEGSGVAAGFTLDGRHRQLDEAAEAALYRVAQESLTNVAKHAAATRARVTLSYLEDRVLLDVRDDGTGFTAGDRTNGFGLAGMRQRLEQVAGALTVDADPGEGTTVTADIPVVAS